MAMLPSYKLRTGGDAYRWGRLETGMVVAVCRSRGLLLDVDTPDDLELLSSRAPDWWGRAEAVLASLRPAEASEGRVSAADGRP